MIYTNSIKSLKTYICNSINYILGTKNENK